MVKQSIQARHDRIVLIYIYIHTPDIYVFKYTHIYTHIHTYIHT